MPSAVDYVNNALSELSVDPIVVLELADSATASIVKPLYEKTVPQLLARHPWRFAITRVQLSRLATTPADQKYRYEYALPANAKEILRTDRRNADWLMYRDEATGYRRLYSNETVVWADVSLDVDPALFPVWFQELLECKLVATFALPLTRRGDIKIAKEAEFKDLLSFAITKDHNENPWPEMDDGDWLADAKYGGAARPGNW